MAITMVVNEAANEELPAVITDEVIEGEIIPEETLESDEEEILSVGFGEDSPPQDDEEEEEDEEFAKLKQEPEFAKKARQALRENGELRKKLRELELKVPQEQKPKSEEEELGPEPELDDDESNFDPVVFKARWKEWNDKKAKIDKVKSDRESAQTAVITKYNDEKTKLKRADFDDAEKIVIAKFDATKQGIILSCAKNPAALIYSLGTQKSLEKLNALSAMTDYAQFTAEMARMESDMKIEKKPKVAPQPQRHINGSSPAIKTGDPEMERAIKEAERTGDRTPVIRLNRERERAKNS